MRAFFERCEQCAGEFDLSVLKADFFLFVGRRFLLHAPQNEMNRARFLLIKAPRVSPFDNLAFERAIEFIRLTTERQFKMHTRRLTTDMGQLIAVNVKTGNINDRLDATRLGFEFDIYSQLRALTHDDAAPIAIQIEGPRFRSGRGQLANAKQERDDSEHSQFSQHKAGLLSSGPSKTHQ